MEPQWHDSLEKIVRKYAEQSQALAWVHDLSQRWCANWNTRLMFPTILFSSLVGVGSIGSEQLLPFSNASTLIGLVSITVGILQTTRDYFAFAKRSESHRIASLNYSKLHSTLSVQLALPRTERKKATDIIEYIQQETEKLADITPIIPSYVKEEFKKKFGSLADYSIPPVLNGLDKVEIQRSTSTPQQEMFKVQRPVIKVEV